MSFPFEYDHGVPLAFGGAVPYPRSFEDSRVVVLPVPVDRTTSYVSGTRNGPREILQASSHMELWDEEIGADVHGVGIFTLPEMELPFGEMAPLMDEIRRVASEILVARQVPGDDRRRALDHAAARRGRGRAVHGTVRAADRRARGSARLLHGHGAQSRLRDAPQPRLRADDAGRHPQHVDGRSAGRARAQHDDFLRRHDAARSGTGSIGSSRRSGIPSTSRSTSTEWIPRSCRRPAPRNPADCRGTRSSRSCGPPSRRRTVVACDVVELSPLPGHHGAQLSVRQADLQDPDLSVCRKPDRRTLRRPQV